MKFERISGSSKSVYINSRDNFQRFCNDFGVVGVKWSQPTNISASYFLRVLKGGSFERARGYGRGVQENDEASNEMSKYYIGLLDHGAMWKLNDGSVICTAMPYGTRKSIIECFEKMVDEFDYPSDMVIEFMDEKYRYRSNGDYMILIYCGDLSQYDVQKEDIEKNQIHKLSKLSRVKYHQLLTKAYNRDFHIKEYAKKRANGICQLCEEKAPFYDLNGQPFLEVHHIKRLADGGSDSVDNTVALCPNCHRKMHILNKKEDVEKLIAKVSV
jgi:5-methylcytosine-specific restriction endonuclease McrA